MDIFKRKPRIETVTNHADGSVSVHTEGEDAPTVTAAPPFTPEREAYARGLQGVQAATVAVKYDAGKAPLSFLHPAALTEIAKVMEFGAKKYARNNWLKGMGWLRVTDACLRHVFAWAWGEDKDPESDLSHLAHAGCCIMFLLTYEREHRGTDDREVPAPVVTP